MAGGSVELAELETAGQGPMLNTGRQEYSRNMSRNTRAQVGRYSYYIPTLLGVPSSGSVGSLYNNPATKLITMVCEACSEPRK